MCIRLGSGAGRNFLSTKDPAKNKSVKEDNRKSVRPGNDTSARATLRRFFPASGAGE